MSPPPDDPALSDAAVRALQRSVDWPDAGERFEICEQIGQGGMGRVYRVRDRRLERHVALKVLSLDSDTPELGRRLSREARVLARLEHPGVVAIHDAGVLVDGRPYYLMRLVEGRTLAELMARDETMPMRGERLRIFLRVCDAVAYAHSCGVVHRDLKPGNIMLGEFGDVVVLDWGVAKVLDGYTVELQQGTTSDRPAAPGNGDVTGDGVVVGTPGFMAPEQATGRVDAVDARADIYALGVLLQLLIGTPSGGARTAPLLAVAQRATASTPADRYPEVSAMAADVRRWIEGESVTAYRESHVERAGRLYRRNRTLIWLVLAYMTVRVGVLVWRGV